MYICLYNTKGFFFFFNFPLNSHNFFIFLIDWIILLVYFLYVGSAVAVLGSGLLLKCFLKFVFSYFVVRVNPVVILQK